MLTYVKLHQLELLSVVLEKPTQTQKGPVKISLNVLFNVMEAGKGDGTPVFMTLYLVQHVYLAMPDFLHHSKQNL